jgi:hypothetical protein
MGQPKTPKPSFDAYRELAAVLIAAAERLSVAPDSGNGLAHTSPPGSGAILLNGREVKS